MPLKKLFLFSASLALGAFSSNVLAAQNPTAAVPPQNNIAASAPAQTPNNDAVQRLIDTVEQQYRTGSSFCLTKQFNLARQSFDRAVDIILSADANLRKDARFRTYYADLIDRIYKQQLSVSQKAEEEDEDGFPQQAYEGSSLDELAKIDLDAEGVSRMGTVDVKGFDFDFTIHPAVVQFINFFTQGKGRYTMESGLRRSGRYRAMTERIFKEEGVPQDIIWLAQVESVWTPQALSTAAAKGIWQFIPSTGERYGLQQNNLVDERISPEKATRAAARYLKFLNEYFAGDWLLAMAAYNCGENGLDRSIARCGYADFWEIYDRNLMPQETRNYVPAILAVTIIAKDPAKYGFNVQPDQPWDYDTFELKSPLDLRVAANLLDTSYESIRELNPELKRSITPDFFQLRLPKASKDRFELAYSQLSPEEYAPHPVEYYAQSRRGGRYQSRNVRQRGHGSYRVKNVTIKRAYGKYGKAKAGKVVKRSHRR